MSNITFTLGDVLAPVQRALRLTAQADLVLARQRIDVLHRELCGITDWPSLRVEGVMSTIGGPLAIAGAAGITSVGTELAGVPYWWAERFDAFASDLAERRLWSIGMPARNNAGDFLFDVWDWDVDTDVRVASTGVSLRVTYWRVPGPLAQDTDRLAIPGVRALVVRAVLDLVGLMDRKDTDVAAWRGEMDSSLAELKSLNPVAQSPSLRLVSGRVLTRGPSR